MTTNKKKIHKHKELEVTTIYKQDGTQETISVICSSCKELIPEALIIFRRRELEIERLISEEKIIKTGEKILKDYGL